MKTEQRSPFGLSPRDQYVLMGITALCILWLAYHAYRTLGPAPTLVEWDQLEPWNMEYRVDINTADWVPLSLLPGLSETLARRIISDRQRNGPFRDPRDLQRVHGLGPKLVARASPHLTGWTVPPPSPAGPPAAPPKP